MSHLSRPVAYRRHDIIRFAVDPAEIQRCRLREALRRDIWTPEDEAVVRAALNAQHAYPTDA